MIIENESFDSYQSKKEWLSSSEGKHYYLCPEHYYFEITREKDEDEESSKALSFGTAYHTLILQPEEFDKKIEIFDLEERPDKSHGITAKENKSWKEMILSDAKSLGRKVIEKSVFDTIQAMAEKMERNNDIMAMLRNGKAEQSYYVEYPLIIDGVEKKVKIRARPDYEQEDAIVDLKTTLDASPNGFPRSIGNYNYDFSAVHYQEAIATEKGVVKPFFWVAQEKNAPYSVALYTPSSELIRKAREDWLKILTNHSICQEVGYYPSYTIYGVQTKGFRYRGMMPINVNYRAKAMSLINTYPNESHEAEIRTLKR